VSTLLEIRDLETHDRISISTDAPELRPIDRIALRVGLALLLWSRRRTLSADPAEVHRRFLERQRAEQERDRRIAMLGLYR
jgi:hypothetical protein